MRGITVTLYTKTQTGVDRFNAPIYEETPTEVENVLIENLSTDDVIATDTMYGKKAVYRLCIPKGDTNDWENVTVEFYGQKFKTFGFPIEYIEHLVPLNWNKKVLVERYG